MAGSMSVQDVQKLIADLQKDLPTASTEESIGSLQARLGAAQKQIEIELGRDQSAHGAAQGEFQKYDGRQQYRSRPNAPRPRSREPGRRSTSTAPL